MKDLAIFGDRLGYRRSHGDLKSRLDELRARNLLPR